MSTRLYGSCFWQYLYAAVVLDITAPVAGAFLVSIEPMLPAIAFYDFCRPFEKCQFDYLIKATRQDTYVQALRSVFILTFIFKYTIEVSTFQHLRACNNFRFPYGSLFIVALAGVIQPILTCNKQNILRGLIQNRFFMV
ncbi:hypothetical protein BGX38DRAFT_280148 [Terfezia claveryi]|nr:hypothetical protein BGX38DRAFT_280148 [Terfezia claveryi]